MKLTTRIQVKEQNAFNVTTLEYVLGILHTYANLNRPNSTLDYEYNLIELPKDDLLIEYLKSAFFIFEKQPIQFSSISEDEFKTALFNWFFKNGKLNSIQIDDRRKNNEVNYFYKVLQDILNLERISRITNLQGELETTYLELGAFYEYLVLHTTPRNFLLYFRYDD